jgi:hypothetical protein
LEVIFSWFLALSKSQEKKHGNSCAQYAMTETHATNTLTGLEKKAVPTGPRCLEVIPDGRICKLCTRPVGQPQIDTQG